MRFLNSRRGIPFAITYVIKHKTETGEIKETEVTVVARNIVDGLAKAINTAHIHLEDIIKAEVKGAKEWQK